MTCFKCFENQDIGYKRWTLYGRELASMGGIKIGTNIYPVISQGGQDINPD